MGLYTHFVFDPPVNPFSTLAVPYLHSPPVSFSEKDVSVGTYSVLFSRLSFPFFSSSYPCCRTLDISLGGSTLCLQNVGCCGAFCGVLLLPFFTFLSTPVSAFMFLFPEPFFPGTRVSPISPYVHAFLFFVRLQQNPPPYLCTGLTIFPFVSLLTLHRFFPCFVYPPLFSILSGSFNAFPLDPIFSRVVLTHPDPCAPESTVPWVPT